MASDTPCACIDVREPGEYNSSHIPGVSLLPRRLLEFDLPLAVPFAGTRVVVCDDDGRRAALAAATLESMGYSNVAVLEGGINRWVSESHPTEWGTNVPSKDFGRKGGSGASRAGDRGDRPAGSRGTRRQAAHGVDTRTPEEYQRFCIPGGRSIPGGELALRITDISVGGAGARHHGHRQLRRTHPQHYRDAGAATHGPGSNVYGLKNGTAGWLLAGYQLETGADRLDLPDPSPEGLAAAEAYAARLAEEDGVRFLDIPALQAMMAKREQEPFYFIDVRTADEYAAGHIPGFRWFPGGQAVQRADDVAVVKPCPIIFACDRQGPRYQHRLVVSADGFCGRLRGGRRHHGLARRRPGPGTGWGRRGAGRLRRGAGQGTPGDAPGAARRPAAGGHFRRYQPGFCPRARARRPLGAARLAGIPRRRSGALTRHPHCRNLQRRAPSHACRRHADGPGLSDRYRAGGRHGRLARRGLAG